MSAVAGTSTGKRDPVEPIAIVGMDCVFPGARDLEGFWRNVVRGVDAISVLGPPRCNPAAYGLAELRGGSIEGLVGFDPLGYGVAPAEVEAGDPEQFVILAVVDRALRDAAAGRIERGGGGRVIDPPAAATVGGRLRPPIPFSERTAIVIGRGGYLSSGSEHIYLRTDAVQQVTDLLTAILPGATKGTEHEIRRRLQASLPRVDVDVVACALPNLTASRVANRLNLNGPAYTVDAACASSLVAVDLVVRELRAGTCDVGIAAGVHINQRAWFWQGFQTLGALSPSGRIRPYAADADGLVVGEGVGAVVLRRMSDAVAAGDRVYAVVRGVGTSSDGAGAGLLAPRAEGQVLAIRRAWESCGLDPRTVALIEGHGTATRAGDATEITALHEAFGREGGRTIALGSVKSMIGHAMPAAGMAGLIKAALSVYHCVLPPTLNVGRIHPELEDSRICVNTTVRPWISPPDRPRRAGVNAFGFGGINAHVILEEASTDAHGYRFLPRSSELFVLSATSSDALAAKAAVWSAASAKLTENELVDACAGAAREFDSSEPFRLAVVASKPVELSERLAIATQRAPDGDEIHDEGGLYAASGGPAPPLALLVPGVGFPGLIGGYTARLAELCLHFPEVRRSFDEADEAEGNGTGPLSHLLFPPATLADEALAQIERDLSWSERSSLGTALSNFATWLVVDAVGVHPNAIAGFSLGESTALVAAGVLRLEDLSRDAQTPGSAEWDEYRRQSADREMRWACVAASADQVDDILRETDGRVSLAMDVAPGQVFLAGEGPAVRQVLRQLEARGVWGQILPVLPMLNPFLGVHTKMARTFEAQVRQYLEKLPTYAPRFSVYSGTRAEPFPEDPQALREFMLAAMTEPVRIRQTITRLYKDGHRVFVQLGSGGKMLPNIRNILGRQAHVALTVDSEHRGGLEQYHHLLARLATLGVPLNVGALYAGRRCRPLDPEGMPKTHVTTRTLSLVAPRLQVSEETRDWLRTLAAPPGGAMPTGSSIVDLTPPERVRTAGPIGDTLALMERFLEVQRQAEAADAALLGQFHQVQTAALLAITQHDSMTAAAPPASALAPELPAASPALSPPRPSVRHMRSDGLGTFPLIGQVVSHAPGRALTARTVLDLSEHVFLTQHALLSVPDNLKPVADRLPTLPMTFEIEMLAEAAQTLVPDRMVAECVDIRAATWAGITEGRTLEIEVTATRTGENLVDVELYIGPHSTPAFTGRAVMSNNFPLPPPPQDEPSGSCPLSLGAFYGQSTMFHGPLFHVIRTLTGMDGDVLGADLSITDPQRMFASAHRRDLIFDPVLLDGLGQLVAYRAWLDRWFIFPVVVGRVRRFGPTPPPETVVHATMRYRRLDSRRVEADIDVVGPDGQVLLRIEGWSTWRMIYPEALCDAPHRPREATVSVARPVPASGVVCRRVRQSDLLDAPADWIARLYLRDCEMAHFREQPAFAWLLGRIAAKDAVREWLRRERGILLHPLEVEIANDAAGAPVLTLPAATGLKLSISHLEDEAIAGVAGGPIGVDLVMIQDRGSGFAPLALTPAELEALPNGHMRHEWLHRAWAAKEATAKAHASGLSRLPRLVVRGTSPSGGTITVEHADTHETHAVWTDLEDGRVFALATST